MREMTRRTTVAVEPPGLVAGPESTLPPAPLAEQVGGANPKSGSEGSPIENGSKVANGLNPSAVVDALSSNVLKDAYVLLTTVTVSIAVACSVSVAVFRTGGWSDPETGDGHAPLVDAEGSVVAFGTFRGQPRVDLVQTQVDQGCPAGDDPTLVVDERVRENGDRLHAELKLLVQVGTVEHATPVVRRNMDIHFNFVSQLRNVPSINRAGIF